MKFIAAWPYGLSSLSLSARTALGIHITACALDLDAGVLH